MYTVKRVDDFRHSQSQKMIDWWNTSNWQSWMWFRCHPLKKHIGPEGVINLWKGRDNDDYYALWYWLDHANKNPNDPKRWSTVTFFHPFTQIISYIDSIQVTGIKNIGRLNASSLSMFMPIAAILLSVIIGLKLDCSVFFFHIHRQLIILIKTWCDVPLECVFRLESARTRRCLRSIKYKDAECDENIQYFFFHFRTSSMKSI